MTTTDLVGDETREWALWLTGTGKQRPVPDLITALITSARHSARAAQDPGGPAARAVVLHHGRIWAPEEPAASGAVRPVLLWSAHCSVCGAPFDEEFGYFATTHEAVEQAVDGDWTTTSGGQLKRRITALEQQAVDLTGQLEERNEELQAARAANRQLISRLNTSH